MLSLSLLQSGMVGWSNFLPLRIPRNVVMSCGNFKSHATRASTARRARLLRSNENRVANSKHTPLASRVIRKNTEGVSDERKEGREHEAETQRVKRQTVDSRGLRREQKRKGSRGRSGARGWCAIKRGEYKEHTRVGKARDRSPRARRRVKRRERPEERRRGSERASERGKERRTPTSKKITIFAYVNYCLTRMNDRPRYFRPPVDSHQIDCLEREKEEERKRGGGRDLGRSPGRARPSTAPVEP